MTLLLAEQALIERRVARAAALLASSGALWAALARLAFVAFAAGLALERAGSPWFGRPLYTAAAVLLVVTLELLALDGRLFYYLTGMTPAFQAVDAAALAWQPSPPKFAVQLGFA